MQEPRRRRRLEQLVLPLSGASALAVSLALACAPSRVPQPSTVVAPEVPAHDHEAASTASGESPPAAPATASSEPTVAPPSETTTAAEPAPAAEAPAELPKDTLVLHVGDSFAAALGIPLGKRFKAAGVRYVLEFQTASYVPTWAFGDELPRYIAKYNPDFVMITLGANEIEIPNPEQRAGAVKRLIKELGGRPCVWVTPPLWKPDTGFIKVIHENAAPCRYIDSTKLVGDLPRKRDKIHPNDEGREIWADAVMGWLGRERAGTPERPWALKPKAD